MRIITYDIELGISPDDLEDKWESVRGGSCGFGSMALFDTHTDRYHLYDRASLASGVQHLNEAELLVSWNGLGFDTPVINAVGSCDGIDEKVWRPQFDIFAEVRKALGRPMKGWKLGQVSERTLGITKSGLGALAPELIAQGRYAALFDYNINDVHLTRLLYNHLVTHGYLVAPDGSFLHLNMPPGGEQA